MDALTTNQIQFIKEHADDDPARLLLSASRYPDMNIPFLAEQIAARRQIREKLPSWYGNDALIFPAKIAAEQCSSEQTALYKQKLVEPEWCMYDLTGGLGIDSYSFSRKVSRLFYIERFPLYCEAAQHNFSVLGAGNITVIQEDANRYLHRIPEADAFYLDPARRGESNKRVFALQDCEPDLPSLLPLLLQKAPKVIAKLSPMADIRMTLELLPGTTSVHILSVKNDCKEVLVVVERQPERKRIPVHCINFGSDGAESSFVFEWESEASTPVGWAEHMELFLYEPNASVLKAGAFKQIGAQMGVKKLHPNSHLYTLDERVEDFPGRIFQVEEIIPFTGKVCKGIAKTIPRANITVRNFPLTVDELRKRTKITDGGSVYLFATTLMDGSKVLIRCRK